jgi:hypothetical protein
MMDEQHLTSERLIDFIVDGLEDYDFPASYSVSQDSVIVNCFSGSEYQVLVSVIPIHLKPLKHPSEGMTAHPPEE